MTFHKKHCVEKLSEESSERICQHCGGSLAGKRSDAKFCSVHCRVASHRHHVGRCDEIPSGYSIDRPIRDMLIEIGTLNMQDEHDPAKVREAFARMCHDLARKYA